MIKQKYNQHKETIHNFFWRGLQIFGKHGIVFLIFILAAKLLSNYDFGIYNYTLAIIFFLIMFADFGLSTSTSKYVAEYNVTNKEKLKAVLFNSGLIILVLASLISILILIFGKFIFKENYIYVYYLLPLIFLIPITSLYDGIYRGLKNFKTLSIISLSVGFISLSFVYLLIKQYGLIGALISQNLFYILLFLVLAFNYREFNIKINKSVMKDIGKYSFVFGIAVFGYYLFSKTDVLILGYFGYIKEIATYELINKIFLILLVPFAIIGQVVAPNFARDFAQKKYKIIYNKLKKYTLFFFIIAIIIGLFSYLIIPFIIKTFLIKYYNILFFQIFPFLLFIFMINISASSVDSGIIVPTGYAYLMSYLYIILGLTNLVLSIIFLKLFGFIGVIYATLFSTIMMVLGLRSLYFYKIKSKIIK